MKLPDDLCVLDAEASCMARVGSYPIELAVAELSGKLKSWLIKPTEDWIEGGLWDPDAERLHRITRQQLLAEGLPPQVVVDEFTVAVRGRRLVSDAARLDSFWLMVLHEVVGREAPVVEPVESLLAQLAAGVDGPHRIEQAQKLALERFPRRHRAADDARRFVEIIRILANQP